MKSSEICQLAINIVAGMYGDVQYRLGNSLDYAGDLKWCNLTWGAPAGYDQSVYNAWHADCIGFVRAVLCGWAGNKNAYGGGANIQPFTPGVYQCAYFNERNFIDSCSSVSNNFSLLNQPCSLLYKSGHVGLYVGEYQIGTKTYNTCECCYGLKYGGSPTWTAPDGNRRADKDASPTDSYWESWGIFNLNGTDYDITEYDGGAVPGATGFGTELSEDEVDLYFPQVYDKDWLTYSYLESLANTLYGMDSAYFRCYAGYVYGENPENFDDYMLYLDSSIIVNLYMGYEYTTLQQLYDALKYGDIYDYYTISAMTNRGYDMEADNTIKGKRTRAGMLLAMLNPNQYVTECVGWPVYDPAPESWRIIYTQYHLLPQDTTQWALKSKYGDRTYDVTGTGIRGGIDPFGSSRKGIPMWMYLRPYQLMEQYRMGLYYLRKLR